MGNIDVAVDADGIATVTMDLEGKVNVMNDEFMTGFSTAIDRLESGRSGVRGVIVTSAKKTFLAGGDLALMARARPGMQAQYLEHFELLKSYLRRLEKLGPPIVALINGTALGGGYELCLSCHHRIALDRDDAYLGLPEIDFGILPAAGGVIRLTHLLGIDQALPWLLQGRKVSLKDALAHGLVDQLAPNREEAHRLARSWILGNPDPIQPFERRTGGYGAHRLGPADRTSLQLAAARARKLGGANNEAAIRIADVAAQSLYLPWDVISRVETRYFVSLVMGQTAQAKIESFFQSQRKRQT